MSSTSTNKPTKRAVGRRKRAIASVYFFPGTGKISVNGMDVAKYFPGEFAKKIYDQPMQLTEVKKYDVSVKVLGGGKSGQLDAMVLGISRALVKSKADHKPILRKAGLITRDSRERQRRMVGTGGKARRQKSSPKR
ncbi:MAG: 30S ribosomal protein S9 [Patescibacteria group bacterium]